MNNGFFVLNLGFANDKLYVITIVNSRGKYCSNQKIANLLDITLEQYLALLISYGAYDNKWKGYIFATLYEANNFVEYLNDKYLLLIRLTDKI